MSAAVETGRCHRCGEPRGSYVHGPMMHPGTFWCERCIVERRTIEARKAAAELDALEQRLRELGGPAERIVCGYINAKAGDDATPFGAFCERDYAHTGRHKVAA